MEKNTQEIKHLQEKLDTADYAKIQSNESVEKIIAYCELGWIPCTPQRLSLLNKFKEYLTSLFKQGIVGPYVVYRMELLISQKKSPPDWGDPENAKNILNTIRDELTKQPPQSWRYGSPDVDAYARGDLATQALGILFLLSIGEKEYVPLLWKEIVASLTRDTVEVSAEEAKKLLKITEGKIYRLPCGKCSKVLPQLKGT